MGFQERLDTQRRQREEASRAQVDAAEREAGIKKATACRAAEALLPEAYEAVAALRRDRERSEISFRQLREPWGRGPSGLGPMQAMVVEREERRLFRGASVRQRAAFGGWWVRRKPFEFEIPLEGSPRVGLFHYPTRQGPKVTLEEFAAGGVYQFHRESRYEGGPPEVDEATADQGLRSLLDAVMEHLLDLP